MTILTVFTEVAPVIGMEVPTSVYSSTEREHVELGALANTMAKRIMRAHEWELLKTLATYTGNGSTEDFSLPSDYDRMLKKTQLWSSSLSTALTHITDTDEWLGLDVQAFDFVVNAWTIYGGLMHIKPAMATGVTAKHFYVSNLVVSPETGDDTAEFTADTDSFRLSEEVLKLGMIWQWKANKGQAYAEDMANYEELLAQRIAEDKGSRILREGAKRIPRDVTIAYPLPLGNP